MIPDPLIVHWGVLLEWKFKTYQLVILVNYKKAKKQSICHVLSTGMGLNLLGWYYMEGNTFFIYNN